MENTKTQAQQEIIGWIENNCDFVKGCEIYNRYGSNTILKRTVFVAGRNFPSIAARLKMELCNIAAIPFDPLNPNTEDLKKKYQQQTPNRKPQTSNARQKTSKPKRQKSNAKPKTPNPKSPRRQAKPKKS